MPDNRPIPDDSLRSALQTAPHVKGVKTPKAPASDAKPASKPGPLRKRRQVSDEETALPRRRKQQSEEGEPRGLAEHLAAVAEADGLDPNRPVNPIPHLATGFEEIERRIVREDRSLVRIAYDSVHNRMDYQVIEPQLTDDEQTVHAFLRDTLVRTLDGRRGTGAWGDHLRRAAQTAVLDHDIRIDAVSLERILYHLDRDFLGYGPIDVMMHDPMLEDISCDGTAVPIYVFHREHGSVRSNVQLAEDQGIDGFVIRLAQRSGKHISIAEPLLDATLPDGSRLQASLGREVTSRGSTFTIRKFRSEPMTPPDLLAYGTMDAAMAAYFWFLMEEGRSLLYAGGTASGKTTSLNAVCQFIPPAKKIVSIEDTREINLLHENWIPGVTRAGFGNANLVGTRAGTVDMYRLLEAALRQRPEYLLVGEVRGKEALTLFQAMATGHAVYSTMHADSVKSAVYRLENEPINVPRMMLQTLDTVAIQGQVKIDDHTARRIKEVVEIIGFDPDTEDLLTNTVFRWDSANDKHIYTGHSEVFEQIMGKHGWSDQELEKRWLERMAILEHLRQEGIRDFHSVAKIIQEYYRKPEQLLTRIGSQLPKVRLPSAEASWD